MDPDAANNFFNNILSMWINPEIERRKTAGELNNGFLLNKAQVIFTIDGSKVIRLNAEVKANIRTNVRTFSDMSINLDDTQESVVRLDRIKEEEDFGHATLLKVRDLWVLAFNFTYGVKTSKQFYKLGKEFLEAAELSLTKKIIKATATNLYIATENLMKARIILYPDSIARSAKTHGSIAGRVNIHARDTKVVKSEYRNAFNFLQKLYSSGARYNPALKIDSNKIEEVVQIVKKLEIELSKLYEQKLIYKD